MSPPIRPGVICERCQRLIQLPEGRPIGELRAFWRAHDKRCLLTYAAANAAMNGAADTPADIPTQAPPTVQSVPNPSTDPLTPLEKAIAKGLYSFAKRLFKPTRRRHR